MLALPRLRLFIADDDPKWRGIIAGLLETSFELVGTAGCGDQILAIAEHLFPDLITLDVSMPGKSGLIALPGIRFAFPKAIIVIVSTTINSLYMEEAFARGADGYIEKCSAGSDLMKTILSVQTQRNQNSMTMPH